MSSDHVLIKLSDFKEICTDLKRSGDIIKGVLKNTLKNKTEIKRAHVKRPSSDKKSHKKAKRVKQKLENTIPSTESTPEESNSPEPTQINQSEDSNSTDLSSEDGY